MQRLSDTQVRFTRAEIQQLQDFAKENGLKQEYVMMNAALVALGHPPKPPSEWNYGVEYE